MKKLLTLFTLVMAVSLAVVPHADAKRFGGGKSYGKSHKTAPAKQQQAQRTDSIQKQGTAAQSGAKKGLMGGMLGGLLAGGLLAALFAGGAFEGIQFMDILIIGVLAFIIFKIIKSVMAQKAMSQRRPQPAYAGPQSQHQYQRQAQPQQTGNFGGGFGAQASDVPFNLPPGFDANGFVNRARDHYMQIQRAWNANDLDKIREYVSADLYQALEQDRAATPGELHNQILFINAELVRADYNQSLAELSLKFSGKYKETQDAMEEDITDIWHLERDLSKPNAPWLIVGIES
ncbi:TIM44-like domain-containing protein [Shewanella corallii]|uniref:TIM44-like domain-containing protein n=1 Tax=Shewanella corallii TaxID=560080 RepID=A0ABT0NE09_9GAMM|nr:TIM44-like domain-containing protein [Shewanella corallii]MCL2916081.1 TIM44-like domain-containing protein [Shewanella corallii]